MLEGSRLCGGFKFTLSGHRSDLTNCHRARCRKTHGDRARLEGEAAGLRGMQGPASAEAGRVFSRPL